MRTRHALRAAIAFAVVAGTVAAGAQPAPAVSPLGSVAAAAATTDTPSDPPLPEYPGLPPRGDTSAAVPTTGIPCDDNGSDLRPTRDQVLDRAQSWLDVGIPYSQSRCYENRYGDYRTDCSGFVSMAWGIGGSGSGHWTGNLLDKADKIARSSLKPGDALLRYTGDPHQNHVALFVKWSDAEHTKPVVIEQTGSSDTIRDTWSESYAAQYTPVRYNHIQEEDTRPYDSFTGDAKADLIVHSGTDVAVRQGSGNGFADLGVVSSGWGRFHGLQITNGMGRLYFADYNADHRTDMIVHNGTDISVRLNTTTGWTDLGVVTSGWGRFHGLQITNGMGRLYFADYNADGRADMIVHNGTDISVRLNTTTGWTDLGVISSGWGRFHGLQITNGMGRLYFADYNADGRADMIVHNGTDISVRLNTTTGWTDLGVITSGWGRFHGLQITNGMGRLYFADIDGDGRADMIVHNGTDVSVRKNTPTGFSDQGVVTTGWGRFHGLDTTDGMGRLYLA
ncbi:FG-GAP repeat domain-containing protein [Actinoplanes teichomyceticus]|uniref:FG-GAP repeat domain-containing protein n=1 Tax=Actinoplanes teichomyceticus TaxID=1867 RepID=UPI000F0A3C23|nr:VCBS repeat-containing protein [Actinoplanes teichomyceticus]